MHIYYGCCRTFSLVTRSLSVFHLYSSRDFTECTVSVRRAFRTSASRVQRLSTLHWRCDRQASRMDGMTIFTIAIVVGIILYAVYRLVKAIVQFTKWTWKICLRAPSIWAWRNVVCPSCECGRCCVYTSKESCLSICDCCYYHYNPYKRMDIV